MLTGPAAGPILPVYPILPQWVIASCLIANLIPSVIQDGSFPGMLYRSRNVCKIKTLKIYGLIYAAFCCTSSLVCMCREEEKTTFFFPLPQVSCVSTRHWISSSYVSYMAKDSKFSCPRCGWSVMSLEAKLWEQKVTACLQEKKIWRKRFFSEGVSEPLKLIAPRELCMLTTKSDCLWNWMFV